MVQNSYRKLAEGVWAKPLYCSREVLVVEWRFEPGAKVPEHSHSEFQVTVCRKGRILFKLGGKTVELGSGDYIVIEPGVSHEAMFPEETIVVDLFAPARRQLYDQLCENKDT